MYLSACIEWLFQKEHPDFIERIAEASRHGFSHVEFHLWRDKPLAQLAQALEAHQVKLSSFVVEPRRSLVDPLQHEAFLQAVRESLAVSRKLGSPPLVIASGFSCEGVSFEAQCEAMHKALSQAARLAEEAGVTLLLEPLNTHIDHPGMFLSDTRLALDVIEGIASERLKLLFDLYHSAVMGERLQEVLKGRIHLVGHVQIAQPPGRTEPDGALTDWRALLGQLQALGYDGAVGLEYKPALPVSASLAKVSEATGLSLQP